MSHGDLDERIKASTKELELKPNNIELLLKRAKLFYQHDEFMRSIRDYEKAEDLGGNIKIILEGYAVAWLKKGQYDFALESIDSLLVLSPEYHKAHDTKAEILMKNGAYEDAALSYRRMIELSHEKQTPLYHNLISAYDSIGTTAAHLKSIHVIEEALKELGTIKAMQIKLVELLIKTNQISDALAIQTVIIQTSNRKERAYLKRAYIHLGLEDSESAQKDLLSSIESIELLPFRIQQMKKMKELKAEIEKLQK